MKNQILIALSAVLLTTWSTPVSAQVLKKLQQKATDAVERKLDAKVDEKIDQMADKLVNKSFDAVFGDMEQAKTKDGTPIFTFGENVALESSYRFNTVITMEFEATSDKGKEKENMDMIMHFTDDGLFSGTRFVSKDKSQDNADLLIIYDFKNEAMVMLMNSDNEKMSMAYSWKGAVEEVEMADSLKNVDWEATDEWGSYRRIGKKSVAGYSCDGYEYSNEGGKVELWVTRELKDTYYAQFGASTNSKQLKGTVPDAYPYGMLMEMNTVDNTTGEKASMRVTKVDKNANVSYSMADYPRVGAMK
jgi:hypothetical protein